jgi:hypothetical protein
MKLEGIFNRDNDMNAIAITREKHLQLLKFHKLGAAAVFKTKRKKWYAPCPSRNFQPGVARQSLRMPSKKQATQCKKHNKTITSFYLIHKRFGGLSEGWRSAGSRWQQSLRRRSVQDQSVLGQPGALNKPKRSNGSTRLCKD